VFELLAPYIGKQATSLNDSQVQKTEVRMCPGGSFTPPPHYDKSGQIWGPTDWNCWVGVSFGAPDTAPFYYETGNPPLKRLKIRHPDDALMFMDVELFYVYSPVSAPDYSGGKWTADVDGDGDPDSAASYQPYSHGRPTVHDAGSNVGMLDGHVQRVPYKILWAVDNHFKTPTCTLWNIFD
jgi:prepilin-type processing-associated H-X9-DG protein